MWSVSWSGYSQRWPAGDDNAGDEADEKEAGQSHAVALWGDKVLVEGDRKPGAGDARPRGSGDGRSGHEAGVFVEGGLAGLCMAPNTWKAGWCTGGRLLEKASMPLPPEECCRDDGRV